MLYETPSVFLVRQFLKLTFHDSHIDVLELILIKVDKLNVLVAKNINLQM